MSKAQIEDGYTKIANTLLEALCRTRIPGEARQVFDYIRRKTHGYNKKQDRIPLSQFCSGTGMKKPTVCRAINKCLALGIIYVIKNDNDPILTYGINTHISRWAPLSKKITVIKKDNRRYQKSKLPLSKKSTSKENISKETKDKEKKVVFPEWFPMETFKEFKRYRENNKTALTKEAVIRMIAKLGRLRDLGNDPTAVIEQTIDNGWSGMYPLRDRGNGSGPKGGTTHEGKKERDFHQGSFSRKDRSESDARVNVSGTTKAGKM